MPGNPTRIKKGTILIEAGRTENEKKRYITRYVGQNNSVILACTTLEHETADLSAYPLMLHYARVPAELYVRFLLTGEIPTFKECNYEAV